MFSLLECEVVRRLSKFLIDFSKRLFIFNNNVRVYMLKAAIFHSGKKSFGSTWDHLCLLFKQNVRSKKEPEDYNGSQPHDIRTAGTGTHPACIVSVPCPVGQVHITLERLTLSWQLERQRDREIERGGVLIYLFWLLFKSNHHKNKVTWQKPGWMRRRAELVKRAVMSRDYSPTICRVVPARLGCRVPNWCLHGFHLTFAK